MEYLSFKEFLLISNTNYVYILKPLNICTIVLLFHKKIKYSSHSIIHNFGCKLLFFYGKIIILHAFPENNSLNAF